MLSRKQMWRRQTKTLKRTEYDFLYNQGILGESGNAYPPRSISEPAVTLLDISNFGRLWSTTGDLELKPTKKSVKFGGAVNVVLIPTRDEYRAAALDNLMWWETNDYDTFKAAAISELKEIMKLDCSINSKMAQMLLYQPSNTPGVKEVKEKITNLTHELPLIKESKEDTNDNKTNDIYTKHNNRKFSECPDIMKDIDTHEIKFGKTDLDIIHSNQIKRRIFTSHEDPLVYVSPIKSNHKEVPIKSSLKSIHKSTSTNSTANVQIRKETVHPLVYMCA
mmetsp:Transcript_21536/g.19603  ORF Transcript_21536/g.19603 Transcript_21536/m.19603 type:complete len:278 (-) Transcript_21536:175-1008(-)